MLSTPKRKIIDTFGIAGRADQFLASHAKKLMPFATKTELAMEDSGCYELFCKVYEFNTGTSRFWIVHAYARRIYYSDIPKDESHKPPVEPQHYEGNTYRIFTDDPFLFPVPREQL